jgi:hypothetical protein
LAGSKWGSNTATISTTYRTYIQPILKYGGEIKCTSSNHNKENISRSLKNKGSTTKTISYSFRNDKYQIS